MNASEAIRLIALRDVYFTRAGLADEHFYNQRQIFRWYSHYFHTPLHIVETIPQIDVLRAYWEQHFEDLDDDQLEDSVRQAVMTDEDHRHADDLEDMEKVDHFVAKRKEQVAKDAEMKKRVEAMKAGRPMPRSGNRPLRPKEVDLVPNPELPKLINRLPTNISMKFSDEEMDFDPDMDSLGLLKKPKK